MSTRNQASTFHLILVFAGILAISGPIAYAFTNNVFAQTNSSDSQPNISAESIFNTKTMTLGNNVKNLVILIPNEGHHAAGEDNEARFLDQHFVPENAVVNTGTTVQWFNGDAGHERTINVKGPSGETVFNTGEIVDSQASNPFTFTNPGLYNYEAEGDPGVTMTGSLTVGNIQSPVISSSSSSTGTPSTSNSSNIDTVGILMVPTQDLDEYISQITNAGLQVEKI
jgi:plastocyanin